MAGALVELPMEVNVEQGYTEENISALILTSHWTADAYGMGQLTRCLINDLRFTDPKGVKINLTCALLEEESKISKNDIDEARKYYVHLRGAKRPIGENEMKDSDIKCLDKYSVSYYSYLLQEDKYDFLIGHVPYLANGICNLKEFANKGGQFPKVVFFVHALPKTAEGEVDESILDNWLKAADIIFLVGHAVKAEIETYLESSDPRVHGLYIPNVPIDLFTIEHKNRKCEGKQVITLITNERKNLNVTGLNYELAMAAAVKAADLTISWKGWDYRNQIRMEFLLLGVHPDERDSWKEVFERIKKAQPEKKKDIRFRFGVIKKTKDLQDFMKQTSVLLLPLKAGSPLFGVEALAAASTGTPFLVSSKAGIASLLQEIEETRPVILDEGDLESDSLFWKKRIFDTIVNPEQSLSEDIKLKLILNTSIASSHLAFIRAVAEKACIRLTIDINHDSNSAITDESYEVARKFGVHLQEHDKENIQPFLTAFLKRLLHHREKIDRRLLDNELPASVKDSWQRILYFLEDKNRKALDIKKGSLNFILFCPSEESFEQLKEEEWKFETEHALLALLDKIVPGIGATIATRSPDVITPQEALMQTIQGTTSIQPPDRQSDSGYDTMSLTSSYVLSEVTEVSGEQKVREWKPTPEGTQELKLEHRWNLTYLHVREKSRAAFVVADCGKIAISYDEIGLKRGSLSVFDVHSTNSTILVNFSGENLFYHPIVIKQAEKEYLAACTGKTNTIVQRWALEKLTDQLVHTTGCTGQRLLCVIDDTTIACVSVIASLKGSHRVSIMDISHQTWTVKVVLLLAIESSLVTDVSYLKTTDGTSCLLLSTVGNVSVWAVDMLTGRIKWKSSWNNSYPVSICNDVDKNIYVADHRTDQVLLLSEEDGTVIGSVNLRKYEIFAPHCIRVHDKFVYLAHKNLKEINNFQISKVSIA